MENQTIFTQSIQHLTKQGGPAIIGDNCVYRSSAGKRCAVGYFIPEWEYTFAMESQPAHDLFVYMKEHGKQLDWLTGMESQELLGELQDWHDGTTDFREGYSLFDDTGKKKLIELADRYDVIIPRAYFDKIREVEQLES